VIRNHERIEVPRMVWPLAAYGAVTLVSAYFAVDQRVSFMDTKQLVLFAIVPIAYRLLPGRRSLTAVDVIITVGALEAIYGIVQYSILNFDHLQRRVQGSPSPAPPRRASCSGITTAPGHRWSCRRSSSRLP
jgi:hypothetical protein